MSNWKDVLNKGADGEAKAESGVDDGEPEIAPPPDPSEYRPWILQRGRGRPAMFIDLRRFEPKTGVLIGCQMSYPHLISVDYLGDRMVSLDFGSRHYVIEGAGLTELPVWLQHGMVLAIQEYSPDIWPTTSSKIRISRIIALPSTKHHNTQ